MKRYIAMHREDYLIGYYEVIDLFTAKTVVLGTTELKEAVYKKKIEIDNIEIVDGKVKFIWQPHVFQFEIYIVAKAFDQILCVSFEEENSYFHDIQNDTYDNIRFRVANSVSIILYKDISIINSINNKFGIKDITEGLPDLSNINERVTKFETKGRLINYPIRLFPIDEENAILCGYPIVGQPTKIPNCCTILGDGYVVGKTEFNSRMINIESGMEYIKYIPSYMFCKVPNSDIAIFENVIEIGERSFGYNDLAVVKIPKSCKGIGEEAFYGSKLEILIIESDEIRIDDSAFKLCARLKTIKITGKLSMGIAIFGECESLETVIFGEGVKNIVSGCFFECRNIKEISLPKTIEHIDEDAFREASDVKIINMPKGYTKNRDLTRWIQMMINKNNCEIKVIEQ